MKGNLTERESLIVEIEYYKHRYDNLAVLTPQEASTLLDCFINESMRRYNKINKTSPLYEKLLRGSSC